MTKEEFIASFRSPLPGAILKKWPNGHITQYWAENPELYSRAFGKHDDLSLALAGHGGIDIVTFEGDKVVAAHDGQVVRVLRDSKVGGNVVYLRSDNFYDKDVKCFVITDYGHLDSVTVNEGQYIKAGTQIGTEGNTGFVVSGGTPFWGNAPAGKGVHLHFGLREYLANGEIRWPSMAPLGGTSDPLLFIIKNNPDYSGTRILLANMYSYLRSLLLKL